MKNISSSVKTQTFWHVRPTKIQISLPTRLIWSVFIFHHQILYPWRSKMRPGKIQISLRECASWSESSLGAHVRRYVFWRCGSYVMGTHKKSPIEGLLMRTHYMCFPGEIKIIKTFWLKKKSALSGAVLLPVQRWVFCGPSMFTNCPCIVCIFTGRLAPVSSD